MSANEKKTMETENVWRLIKIVFWSLLGKISATSNRII